MNETTIFEAHSSYVLGLVFTGDGRTLISCGMDNLIKLWTVPDWTPITCFYGHANSVNGIALSPDEKTLLSGSTDSSVKLWSFPGGELQKTLIDRKKTVSAVGYSPDGALFGAAFYGGRAVVWTASGEPVVGIKASAKNLSSIAFSADNQTLATAGLGDDIFLWSLPDGSNIGSLKGHQTAVGSLTFIEQDRFLVSLGYEGAIKFWDTETWKESRSVRSTAPTVRAVTFSPDYHTAALSMESKVQLWEVEDWSLRAEIPISTKAVSAVAFSADGRWLAVGAADRKIRVMQLPELK